MSPAAPPASPTPPRRALGVYGAIFLALVTVCAAAALPAVLVLASLPGHQVRWLQDRGKSVAGSAAAAVPDADRAAANAFAAATLAKLTRAGAKADAPDPHLGAAFALLLDRPALPDNATLQREFDAAAADRPETFTQLDVAALRRHHAFWQRELAAHPGLLERYRRHRRTLVAMRVHAVEAGFDVDDVYFFAAPGHARPPYDTHLLFAGLNSGQWAAAPGYPGQLYKSDSEWRSTFMKRARGYLLDVTRELHILGVSVMYDMEFDTDAWGTWMSVGYALPAAGGFYNIVGVDFRSKAMAALIHRLQVGLATVALLVVLLALGIAAWIARRIAEPIRALSAGAAAAMDERYDHTVAATGFGEFRSLIDVFNRMLGWVGERVKLHDALRKVLGEDLAETVAQQGLSLGGEELRCTVMFTDFAGFSTISRHMAAADVVAALNDYFSVLVPIVQEHGGFVDKYIGDAIVGVFGAPVHVPDHADRAIQCAVRMQQRMRELNAERRAAGQVIFEMRVGLNTGEVVVGAIGCDAKLEYTVIGEPTNLANRMEGGAPVGHIMANAATMAAINPLGFAALGVRKVPREVKVKGYAEPMWCAELRVDELAIERTSEARADGSFYRYSAVT